MIRDATDWEQEPGISSSEAGALGGCSSGEPGLSGLEVGSWKLEVGRGEVSSDKGWEKKAPVDIDIKIHVKLYFAPKKWRGH